MRFSEPSPAPVLTFNALAKIWKLAKRRGSPAERLRQGRCYGTE
jgi:hypothetical protein